MLKISLLIIVTFFSACGPSGILITERTNEAERRKAVNREVQRVIVTDPGFSSLRYTHSANAYSFYHSMQQQFAEIITQSGPMLGIDIEVYYHSNLPEEPADYFDDLLQIKRQVMYANQRIESDRIYTSRNEGTMLNLNHNVFDYNPQLPADLSRFAEKYQTPYFSYMGVAHKDQLVYNPVSRKILLPFSLLFGHIPQFDDAYFFHIVANLEEGEIIYREVREVTRMDKAHLKSIVYDSFNILRSQ